MNRPTRSLQVVVDLTVPADASDFAVCDFIFELLVNDETVDANAAIFSVDGTYPDRKS